jgi:hypothetical protein
MYDVRSKDGVNQTNACVTTRQAGQSKKMAEARLLFEEGKTVTILIQFFPFLKCVYIFGTLCILIFRTFLEANRNFTLQIDSDIRVGVISTN